MPEDRVDLEVFLQCYERLKKGSNGFALQEIPFIEVMQYAELVGFTDLDDKLHFYELVKACDEQRSDFYAAQQQG